MLKRSKLSFRSGSRLIFTGLCCLFLLACGESRVVYFNGTMLEAFEKAKAEDKRVFVLATDSACGKCKSFEKMLDEHVKTRDILNEDYICVKQELRKKSDRVAFEMMRVPSYPYPYFFEHDGKLLGFGYPNNPDYDIEDLSSLVIDPLRFRELFYMDIPSGRYKQLVTASMKATLALKNDPDQLKKAFDLFHASAQIYPYPYNLRYLQLLGKQVHGTGHLVDGLMKQYKPNPLDSYIYAKELEYSFLSGIKSIPVERQSVVSFPRRKIDIGEIKINQPAKFSFDVQNDQDKAVLIEKVDHPCDCMAFAKPSFSIAAGAKSSISGAFTPYASGAFSKEIYVHLAAPYNYSETITLTGTVN